MRIMRAGSPFNKLIKFNYMYISTKSDKPPQERSAPAGAVLQHILSASLTAAIL